MGTTPYVMEEAKVRLFVWAVCRFSFSSNDRHRVYCVQLDHGVELILEARMWKFGNATHLKPLDIIATLDSK